jgi:uncharacterized protein (DUF885 family)
MRPILASLCALAACAAAGAQPAGPDAAFAELAGEFVAELFATYPVLATRTGDHAHDGELDDVSPEAILTWVGHLRQYRARLQRIDVPALSPENQVDAQLLGTNLEAMLFELTELREYTWNPLYYNDLLGGGLYALAAREFAPWPERLASVLGRLQAIPRLIAQAEENLQTAPRVHVETAIRQNQGTISLVRSLEAEFPRAPDLAPELRGAAESAAASLEGYGRWLQEELLPRASRDFRIGPALFDQKLAFSLATEMSREEILRRAEAEFGRVRDEMYDVSRGLYRRKHPYTDFPEQPDDAYRTAIIRAALEDTAAQHPAPGELLDAARGYLDEATRFVESRGLITLPEEPIRIVEVPEFMRGVAVAYCDAPGLLDRDLDTLYMVSPIPADWSAERAESFLREYNAFSMRELTIHEAMPGHYVQLAHANRFPSVLRAVFASGTFIEGWAVYAEWMMIDEGFGADDPRMRLTRLKWYLRTVVNAILDQKVHTAGMTEEEAMRLLVEGAFQEEEEARGKWRRAQLTSTQLSTYFVGFQEHADMRREVEAQWQDEFHLRDYHDLLLAHGSPPMRYLRALLLQ